MVTTTDSGRLTTTPRQNLLRLPSLTGMRWVAAFLVFVFHLGYVGGPTGSAIHHVFGRAGHLGVTFFFILSGFVLTYSARSSDTLVKFWRRRAAKIFPNHWATFLLAAVLAVTSGQALVARDLLPNLFLVHTWIPRLESWISGNPVSWSLSCELLFYVSFPLWKRLIDRIPVRQLWASAGVIAAAIVAAPLLVQAFVAGTPRIPYATFGPVSYDQLWLVYFFPLIRVLEFILGIVMARIVLSGRWIPVGMGTAALLVAAGQVFALTIPSTSYLLSISAAPALPVALLIAAGASADIGAGRSPFRSRTMVFLGEVSFAFYMVHKLVQGFVRDHIGASKNWNAAWPLSQWLVFSVISFVISLGLAALLYRFVEMPALRRFGTSRKDREARSRGSVVAAGHPER